MPKLKRKIRMCKELAAAKKKKKIKKILQLKFLKSAEENEESSTILETFENVEENMNVEEESAGKVPNESVKFESNSNSNRIESFNFRIESGSNRINSNSNCTLIRFDSI